MFDLIKFFEGLRLEAYKCPAGKWTIGYGTTLYPDGTPVKEGDKITKEQADSYLEWYCANCIELPKGVQFTHDQKTALYSLIYNIGQSAFDKSVCKKAIENMDWTTAYKNWDWIRANGKVLKGLIARRQAERELFFEGLLWSE